jgi:hypothetical protein
MRRPWYLVIREGDAADPENAVDRVVVDDQRVLRGVAELIARELGVALPATVVPLRKADA